MLRPDPLHDRLDNDPSDNFALLPEDIEEVFAIASMGVWRWEIGSQLLRWSAEIFRIAGRDPARFIPTLDGSLQCIHPEDRQTVGEKLFRAGNADNETGVEFRVVRPDGAERYCWAKVSRVLDGAEVVAIRGTLLDLTSRREAELALAASEQHYRDTVDLSPQMPWTASPEGAVLTVSARWTQLTGLPERSALGDGWIDQLDPEDRDSVRASVARSLSTAEPLDIRARLRCVDGELRWIRARAFPKRDATGRILRWYGLTEDIDEQVRTECALRSQEDWLRKAHSAAGIGLFEIDLVRGMTKLSPQSLALHGRYPEEDPLFTTQGWADLVHPDDGGRAWEAVRHAAESGDTYDVTFRVPLSGGVTRWLNGLGRVEYGEDGRPRRLLGINMDVTSRREAEAALFDSEALNRSIVDASSDGIKLLDEDGIVMFANQASRHSMELDASVDLVGRNWIELWPATVRPKVAQALAHAGAGKIGHFAAPRPTANGRPKWWDVRVSPILGDDGHPNRFVAIARDVTEQKTAEDRIQWSATHDPLTHLPNRRHFDERLTRAIAEAEAGASGLALFLLDVDDFKQINDTLGHDAGDEVLRTLADRLRTTLRPCDTVARLGGDEFAIIIPGIGDAASARQAAEDLRARLREPVAYSGFTLDCRASIGASLYPDHGTVPGDLLKHADIALYTGKANRGGDLLIFEPEMRAELQQRVSMVNVARDALHQGRFRAFYQPKFDLLSGAVTGFEALTRWVDLRGTVHLPATIAAAFDDWDVSTAITELMLNEVVDQIAAWEIEGIDFGHVALNASAPDLQRSDFVDLVLYTLRQARVAAHRLQIEITESVFLGRGADLVEQNLRRFAAAGVTIALDDFGTGYASLTHLKQFPVDIIKIDRSFIADIDRDAQASAIPEALISLGRNLGLEVVAEGVETRSQADRLMQLGCHYAQGFLYSPAVSAERAREIVSRAAVDGARHRP